MAAGISRVIGFALAASVLVAAVFHAPSAVLLTLALLAFASGVVSLILWSRKHA